MRDWKEAITLAPENASLYAQVAEAYIELGDLSRTLENYKKAIALNPSNHGYTERYQKLKGKSS